MNSPQSQLSVTANDIAHIAQVTRSAVANWRKRHEDFPLPNSSERFDLNEVERWLIEKGKIAGRAPRAFLLWRVADLLRDLTSPADVMNFVLASLVYLEACERAQPGDSDAHPLQMESKSTWSVVRQSSDDALGENLLAAAVEIEQRNPVLVNLIASGLGLAAKTNAWLIRMLLDTIEDARKDDVRVALFEQALARVQERDRFRGEFSTPPELTQLMVRLGAAKSGTIFDPACGDGGLLLGAALGNDRDSTESMALIGIEENTGVMDVSRARFFLHDVPATLLNEDAFRVSAEKLPTADLVLLDPPLGMKRWGDADVYLSDRWRFGVPPPSNADLAWVQLAIQSLAPTGRAIVVTTPRALFSGGRESAIRSALLAAGCVRAIVLLPRKMRANISIDLALWVLQAPTSQTPEAVLLVDAGQLGHAGRSTHTLDEADIDRIVSAVNEFEVNPGQMPKDPAIAWSVAISDLHDGVLDPSRYRPAAKVDLGELRRRRQELRESLKAKTSHAEVAVAAVLARLKESR